LKPGAGIPAAHEAQLAARQLRFRITNRRISTELYGLDIKDCGGSEGMSGDSGNPASVPFATTIGVEPKVVRMTAGKQRPMSRSSSAINFQFRVRVAWSTLVVTAHPRNHSSDFTYVMDAKQSIMITQPPQGTIDCTCG